MGDPLGSGQEMDKTVRPKAKADNISVCEFWDVIKNVIPLKYKVMNLLTRGDFSYRLWILQNSKVKGAQ